MWQSGLVLHKQPVQLAVLGVPVGHRGNSAFRKLQDLRPRAAPTVGSGRREAKDGDGIPIEISTGICYYFCIGSQGSGAVPAAAPAEPGTAAVFFWGGAVPVNEESKGSVVYGTEKTGTRQTADG